MDKINNKKEFEYNNWCAKEFTEATPLKDYVSILKKQLIGKNLNKILVLKEKSYNIEEHKKGVNFIRFNKPAIILIEDVQLDVWFYNYENIKIALNQISLNENDYKDTELKDYSQFFSSHVVGKVIKDVFVKTNRNYLYIDHIENYEHIYQEYYKNKEKIQEIVILLENNYRLKLSKTILTDSEPLKECFKSTDSRLIVGETPLSEGVDFINFEAGDTIDEDEYMWSSQEIYNTVNIYDDDLLTFYTVIKTVIPEFSEYDYSVIPRYQWRKILDNWKLFCEAETFDEVFENFCNVSYEDHYLLNENPLYILNNSGVELWEKRKTEKYLYENFNIWVREQLKTHECITVRGF